MEFPQINVAVRSRTGKGPARRLRNSGQAPAVLYGAGIKAIPISVVPKDLIKALSGPLHTNTVLALNVTGSSEPALGECKVMVRDHQYDPLTRALLHVDFLTVKLDKKVQVNVPMEFVGRSLGEQAGGKITAIYRSLPVECLPESIPISISVDISSLNLNDFMAVKDIKLPDGVTATLPPEANVVGVQTIKEMAEEVVEAKEEAAEGEGEKAAEGAEGEAEGKPAKDAKDAKDTKDAKASKGSKEKS